MGLYQAESVTCNGHGTLAWVRRFGPDAPADVPLSRICHAPSIDDLHLQLLGPALLSQAVFAPITQSASAQRSDSMLNSVHDFLQTDPSSVSHLQPIEGERDWLAEFKARLFESFREGLAISRYHLDQAELIETQIREIADQHEAALLPHDDMVLGLSCRPLVAEYQAFEMALRRSLEYLAGAISAYFESVSPGVVNIGRKSDGSLWVRLHGDAEDLNPLGSEQTKTLFEALEERIQRVEDLALGLFQDLGITPG